MTARRSPSLVAGVAAIVVSGCSSSGPGASPSASAYVSTPSPTATATPTAIPIGPPLAVWSAGRGTMVEIRAISPAGGPARVVASIPTDAQVLGVGAGKVAVLFTDRTIHIYALASSIETTFPSGAGASDSVFGGAFSPDGTRLAYATAAPGSGTLRILTLTTGVSAVVHTYTTNTVDAPGIWTATRIVAITVVGFSDAGPQAVVAIDPATGTQTSSTSLGGSGGPAISADGVHAADSVHAALGDEGDSSGGPGPQQPFNTMRTYTIGATPTSIYSKAHHQIGVLGVSTDGSTLLYDNGSSAGAFAGISMSPDFGLFLLSSGTTTQVAHYGDARWDAGAFIDVNDAVVARNAGGIEQLVAIGTTHPVPTVLDAIAGGVQPVGVWYSPIS